MQFLEFTQSKGISANLPAHFTGGTRASNLFLVAHPPKADMKFGGGEKRSG
jgi:hypothetical protein